MKKIVVFFLLIILISGCSKNKVDNNIQSGTNVNEVEKDETNTNEIEKNENTDNSNIQQDSNEKTEIKDVPAEKPQKKPENSNDIIIKDEENKNNDNNNNNINNDTNIKNDGNNNIENDIQNETTEKYTYIKDAVTYRTCPNGYSDRWDYKNCYKYMIPEKKWGCEGQVIDETCYSTYIDQNPEYYCDGNDMYWEVKDRGRVIDRLCRRYVLDIVKSDALGNCPDGYTLNDDNKCEGYIHSMENKYKAHVKYNCKDGYTLNGNICMKKTDYKYIYTCSEGYNLKSCNVDNSSCICFNQLLKTSYILTETCENDSLILKDGKCYSIE